MDPFEIDSYIKKKQQEQDIVVTVQAEDRPVSSSRISNQSNHDQRGSQMMEASHITAGERLRNSFIKESKIRIRGSTISNNDFSNKASKITNNLSTQHPLTYSEISKKPTSFISNNNVVYEHEAEGNVKDSRMVHEESEGPCECEFKLSVVWTDSDPKRCEQLLQ